MRYISHSLQDTYAAAAELAAGLHGGEVIAFTGPMGAGKTAFTRGLVAALGGADVVSSPTFAIVNEYSARLTVKHFDMYRIQGSEDLYSTGFFDDLEQENTVLLIEWSENIREFLPPDVIRVDMQPGEDEDSRIITVTKGEGSDADFGN